jgi:hypothetical protein
MFDTKKRVDGPRSGQSAPVGRTVRACVEQIRVLRVLLCLLARFSELAREVEREMCPWAISKYFGD